MVQGKTLTVAAAIALLAAVGACDVAKQLPGLSQLGGNGNQNLDGVDEGVKRPPLTLPPDFNLRPPSVGTASATDFTAAQQGRQTVFGLDQEKDPAAGVQRKAGRTIGESALLQHAGASGTVPDIRRKVDQQTTTLDRKEQVFTNNLLKGVADQPSQQPQKADSGWLDGIFSTGENKPVIERSNGGLF